MFDVDALKDGAMAKVREMIDRCRNGDHISDRGAKAKAITQEEAEVAVSRHIRGGIKFSADDFPAYVDAYPVIIETHVSGQLSQVIPEQVTQCVVAELKADLTELLLTQYDARSLEEALAKLEERISNTLEYISQFHGYQLASAIRACREDPGEETLTALSDQLLRYASQMQDLIYRLDIADPPTADYAGRGRRILLETSDHIRLIIQRGLVDEFCSTSAAANAL
jgi:hypothetical protein